MREVFHRERSEGSSAIKYKIKSFRALRARVTFRFGGK